MTVYIQSDNQPLISYCSAFFELIGCAVKSSSLWGEDESADIMILDLGKPPVKHFGTLLTVVVSAWDFPKRELPEGALSFRKPLDTAYMCDRILSVLRKQEKEVVS